MVFPQEREWRRHAIAEELKHLEGSYYWCPDFEPTNDIDDQSALILREDRPYLKACTRRNPAGERNHNWCYRCPAGLMHVQLHVYDAERTRDRAVRLW